MYSILYFAESTTLKYHSHVVSSHERPHTKNNSTGCCAIFVKMKTLFRATRPRTFDFWLINTWYAQRVMNSLIVLVGCAFVVECNHCGRRVWFCCGMRSLCAACVMWLCHATSNNVWLPNSTSATFSHSFMHRRSNTKSEARIHIRTGEYFAFSHSFMHGRN